MKVIIDLIEDIRESINNEKDFSLGVMGLKEQGNGEFVPEWQSDLCRFMLDDEHKRLYLFLGKEKPLQVGEFLTTLNSMSNESMMYELFISYTKEGKRVDAPLMGFGESFHDKKYLLFIRQD